MEGPGQSRLPPSQTSARHAVRGTRVGATTSHAAMADWAAGLGFGRDRRVTINSQPRTAATTRHPSPQPRAGSIASPQLRTDLLDGLPQNSLARGFDERLSRADASAIKKVVRSLPGIDPRIFSANLIDDGTVEVLCGGASIGDFLILTFNDPDWVLQSREPRLFS